MKFKNKILAGVLAVVLAFGVLGLPMFNLASALALTLTASQTLEVKNVDKNYDVAENYIITFSDYCTTAGAEVVLYKPNGEVLKSGELSTLVRAEFRTPGLYALQFKLEEIANFYIYSDVIYIPVSSGDGEESTITLDGKLNSVVKPGTVVTIPMPIDGAGEEDQEVTIKVYNPYGKEIAATKSSVTQKWSFTNESNVYGTYYVEYSKKVPCGRYNDTMYKYETISFDENSTNTVSTTTNTTSSESTSEAGIVLSGTGIASEKDNIYLFKNYSIGDVIFKNADGTTKDTDIFLTIYDSTANKYYNFTNGNFDLLTSTSTGAKENVKNITSDFVLKNFENINVEGYLGHEYEFTYSTSEGENYTKKITKQEKFNEEAIIISASELPASEITTMTKVAKVESFNIGQLELSKVKIEVASGYNLSAVEELISSIKLELKGPNAVVIESKLESAGAIDSNGVGLVQSSEDYKTATFTYHYNKNMAEEQIEFVYRYIVTIGADEVESDLDSQEYTIYARTKSRDTEAPSTIKVSGATVSTNGKYIVPEATANDKDNDNRATVGTNVVAEIIGGNYLSYTEVVMGQELENLIDGDYTIKYTATDTSENKNSRVTYFSFKVITDQVQNFEQVYVTNFVATEEDEKTAVTVDTNADYVLVFGGNDGAYSPTKVTYEAGEISAFEFEYDKDYNCIIVFASKNTFGTSYTAVKVNFGQQGKTVASFGYSSWQSSYAQITPNVPLEAKVGNNLLWFGNQNFEIEAPENAKFVVTDGNMFTFYTAGVYVITSTESSEINGEVTSQKAITTITIKNELSQLSVIEPLGNKLVVDKDENGAEDDIVNLNYPIVSNYYGYELSVLVKDSSGRVVDGVLGKTGSSNILLVKDAEVYTVEYTFKSEELGKTTHSVKVVAGNVSLPTITLPASNANQLWKGETIKYYLQTANAIDKNGNNLTVSVSCYDQYGNVVEVKSENNQKYVELNGAGFYTVYYTAIDSENRMSVVESNFAIEFEENEENDGLSAWAIIGIIFASLVVACGSALCIIFAIKKSQSKKKFINKAKEQKKQEKKELEQKRALYTIAECKDEKHWIVKLSNRTIAKVNSKAEAIAKVDEVHKKGDKKIKVYNKMGRLIDSL